MKEYPDFASFAEESKPLDGDKKKIDDILGQNILVLDFKINPSKQNKGTSYATIQFKIDKINYVVFTGSSVLSGQLEKYKDNLPFNTVIKKINKYYTFS